MTCGLASCPDLMPLDNNASVGVSIGFLQTVPPDFEREELQSIRDRARSLSIQGSPAKTMEERLYQQMADIADQLDAIAARWEADIAKSQITISPEPMQFPPGVWCKKPGCCGNPPLTYMPLPVISLVDDPIGDLNT